jgi:hypothetical protein
VPPSCLCTRSCVRCIVASIVVFNSRATFEIAIQNVHISSILEGSARGSFEMPFEEKLSTSTLAKLPLSDAQQPPISKNKGTLRVH